MSGASANSEVVVLTGAGASVKLGIPAMEGMMQMYREKATRGAQAKQALEALDTIKATQDLEEMLLEIERVIEFPKTAIYQLVKRIVAVEGETSARRFPPGFRELKKDIQVLRKDLLDWIARTCFQFDRDEAERIWGELCKVLAAKNYPVFTSNYDFAMEEIAEAKGVAIVDNFSASANRWFWDESLSSFNKAGLRLVKLHGSVNWYVPQGKQTIEKLDVDATTNREGILVERVVIFPTRFKDIYEPHYFALYKMFLEALSTAKVLIVIGHSLRDEYVRAAIRESFRNPGFHLVVISPDFPTWPDIPEPRGKGISQTTHVPLKFEDFSLALGYILQVAAPSEVPKKCAEVVDFQTGKRKNTISFDPAPASILTGKSFRRVVRIEGLILRPAEVVVSIGVPGRPGAPPTDLHVIEKGTGTPPTILGIGKLDTKVVVQVPRELPAGRTKMVLALRQEDGTIIAQKEYTSHIK